MKNKIVHFFCLCAIAWPHFSSCTSGTESSVSITEMQRVVKTLASDEFMGRQPFTEGERITVAFLADELRKIGFEAPFGGSYFQEVPMIEITSKVTGKALFNVGGENLSLTSPDEIAINSPQNVEQISLSGSQLVFCGFGIVAPEYGWNDFEGVDVRGKTVVVLINDPGLYTNDSSLFRGREMTYYGRWTYKYEQAAKMGADAILIIHESLGAGYEYNVPRKSSITSKLFIDDTTAATRCKITGWLPASSAELIFGKLGFKVSELRAAACKRGFKPFELKAKFSSSLDNEIVKNKSTNVAGILRGSSQNGEAIIITAHWDHFGIGEAENGDSIYNGAVDNGTTMAWALEIGSCFSKLRRQPERSVILLFPTAEEQGLTGSEYYTEHPIVPMDKTIACLNNDMMVPRGRMKDVTMIGFGYSTLDSLYKEESIKQGRYLLPDPDSHTGLFFRSDHFPFFKKGVPSIWAMGCFDSREHGQKWARDGWDYYIKNVYHRPADNYNESWNWDGIKEDTELAFNIAYQLTSSTKVRPRLF